HDTRKDSTHDRTYAWEIIGRTEVTAIWLDNGCAEREDASRRYTATKLAPLNARALIEATCRAAHKRKLDKRLVECWTKHRLSGDVHSNRVRRQHNRGAAAEKRKLQLRVRQIETRQVRRSVNLDATIAFRLEPQLQM